MLNDVIVIHNVVPKDVQDRIERICFSTNFGWFFNHSTDLDLLEDHEGKYINLIEDTMPDTTLDSFQFTHALYRINGEHSAHYPTVATPLLSAIPVEITGLLRVKANLLTRVNAFTDQNHGVPHTDCVPGSMPNYITALYYVNDSDGDTLVFNEPIVGKELTVKERISPRKGTMIILDGNLLHCSSNPIKNDLRCVVNINVIPNETSLKKLENAAKR
jgi:hypothetical protein